MLTLYTDSLEDLVIPMSVQCAAANRKAQISLAFFSPHDICGAKCQRIT